MQKAYFCNCVLLHTFHIDRIDCFIFKNALQVRNYFVYLLIYMNLMILGEMYIKVSCICSVLPGLCNVHTQKNG